MLNQNRTYAKYKIKIHKMAKVKNIFVRICMDGVGRVY